RQRGRHRHRLRHTAELRRGGHAGSGDAGSAGGGRVDEEARRMTKRTMLLMRAAVAAGAALVLAGCSGNDGEATRRATGYVEAAEVHLAARIPGRVEAVLVVEGDRVDKGTVVARLSTAELDLALERARAERQQAEAQLRLLRQGARPEEIRQAEAQLSAARAEQAAAAADL